MKHPMQDEIPVTIAPGTVCDFCSTSMRPEQMTVFPCPDFMMRTIQRGSDFIVEMCHCHAAIATQPGDVVQDFNRVDGWGACPHCAAAVSRGDRDGLYNLAYETLRLEHGPALGIQPGSFEFHTSVTMIAASLEGFWMHYQGAAPVAIGAADGTG